MITIPKFLGKGFYKISIAVKQNGLLIEEKEKTFEIENENLPSGGIPLFNLDYKIKSKKVIS